MNPRWLAFILILIPSVPAASLGASLQEMTSYGGMCDASAAVAIGSNSFLVANDEDNTLRYYSSANPGGAAREFDLSATLDPDHEGQEADLEGAARIGDRIYWIASHGTNKNGKPRRTRRCLFATDVAATETSIEVTPVAAPYRDLVEILAPLPSLVEWHLASAAKIAPEKQSGLNIEGLAATPDGKLLIGFRNPIVQSKALIVRLDNPGEVIQGKPAQIGAVIPLPLAGLGIRSIEYSEAQRAYFLIAGPSGDGGPFRLLRWSGGEADPPQPVAEIDFQDLNPEAMFLAAGDPTKIIFLSDDGQRTLADGTECKDAPTAQRTFRAAALRLDPAPSAETAVPVDPAAATMRLTIYDDGRSCPAGCDSHVVFHNAVNGTANAHLPASAGRPYEKCRSGEKCRICFEATAGSCISVMYRGAGPHRDAFDFTPAFYEEWCPKPDLPARLATQCRSLEQAARSLDGKVNCIRNPAQTRCTPIIAGAQRARDADQPLYDECVRLGEAAFNQGRETTQQRSNACAYEKIGTGRNSQGRTWRKLLPAACRQGTYVGRDGLDCCSGNPFSDGPLGIECRHFYLAAQ